MKPAAAQRRKQSRAEKNEATTAALLAAAVATFAERGFEAATMEEIAERVGLSKGALYYRYRTKEDLFLAMLDERCAAYIAQLERPATADGSPAAAWGPLANLFLEVVREGTWPRLFFEFVSYAARSPRTRRELVKRTRKLRAAMTRLVETQTARAGGDAPIPAPDIALALIALGNGLALERLADPRGVSDQSFIELPALIMAPIIRAHKEDRSR